MYQYINNSNNVSNQIFLSNNHDEESNDFSSLNLSSMNSIGSSTVAKFDYLLDQIQQIKDCVNDSFDDVRNYDSHDKVLFERRLSDGEFTLPSLEWDLGDIPDYNENVIPDNDELKNSLIYDNVIDADTLSQLIFNKDFILNEEKLFIMKKQFRSVKHRLKYFSKNSYRRRNQNMDSLNYRINRDSAFFEDFS